MSCGIFPCVTVNTGTVALIEQFGKFTKIAKPGLNVVIPCFCEFPAATVNPTTDLITLALAPTRSRIQTRTGTCPGVDAPPANGGLLRDQDQG